MGLEFPWELRNFTTLAVLHLGRETREGHFRELDWPATSCRRGSAPVVALGAPDPHGGEHGGALPGVWPDFSLQTPPSPSPSGQSLFLSNTLTRWVICLQSVFIFNLNTEHMGKCHTSFNSTI